jgi:tetratricopeptide (TPR) repeat protein
MRKLIFLSLLLFLVISCASAPKKENNSISKEEKMLVDLDENLRIFNEAKAAFEAGDYKKAKKLFLESNSEDRDFYLALSDFYLGNLEAGKREFLKLIHLNRYKKESLYNLGLIENEQNNVEKALDYMSRVLKIDKAHPGSIYFIASYFYSKREYKKALNYYKIGKNIKTNQKDMIFGLFMTLKELYKVKDALLLVDSLVCDDKLIVTNVSHYLMEQKRYHLAVDYLKKSIKLGANAETLLVRVLFISGDYSESLRLADSIISRDKKARLLYLDSSFTEKGKFAIVRLKDKKTVVKCRDKDKKILELLDNDPKEVISTSENYCK